jgi:hypothetical protein
VMNKTNGCLCFCCVGAVMVTYSYFLLTPIFHNGCFVRIESETYKLHEFAYISSSHFFALA